jgi:hypothetical protein
MTGFRSGPWLAPGDVRDEESAAAVDIHARKAVNLGERVLSRFDHPGKCRATRSLLVAIESQCASTLRMTDPMADIVQPIYPASLLHADGPKRLVKATGGGVLDQFLAGCFATLCARKFLCRYHGAIDSPEQAHDDQNMGHNILLTVLLAVRVPAAANNLVLRLAWPRCPQAGRIARPIQISRTAPMKPQTR